MVSGSRRDHLALGRRLRLMRERAGLSRGELAVRLNVPPDEWSRYERGAARIPAPVLIEAAAILRIPLIDLFVNWGVRRKPAMRQQADLSR